MSSTARLNKELSEMLPLSRVRALNEKQATFLPALHSVKGDLGVNSVLVSVVTPRY